MAHNVLDAQCTVYVWFLNRKGMIAERLGPVGHAALKVSDGEGGYRYMSFWPADQPGDRPAGPGPNSRLHIAQQLAEPGEKPGVFSQAIAKALTPGTGADTDSEHEGRKPDYRCRIYRGLNFKAMVQFAKGVMDHTLPAVPGRQPGEYHFIKQNCSHAVAYCLNAGEPPVAVPLKGWVTNIIHPTDIYYYCQKLASKLNETFGTGAAVQTSDKNVWQ